MCAEAPVRGNATMRDIVPTHGNATTSYNVSIHGNATTSCNVSMHGNALTLDSILAENMIGAGVIPGPLPYCDRSMQLRLGFGPPSRVGERANPQGAQLIPIFRRDCAASSQSRKVRLAFARRWRRVFLSGSADYRAPETSGPSGFQLLGTWGRRARVVAPWSGSHRPPELRLSLSLSCLYPTAARGSAQKLKPRSDGWP